MFRGKESSNRIELSRLVQDLLNFRLPAALWRGQAGGGTSGGMGGVPTHAHACTCTHAHLCMYRNCKWPPTWRHPCLACLTCLTYMCVRACVCIHACMGHPPTHPYQSPPHPPIFHPRRGVDPQNH